MKYVETDRGRVAYIHHGGRDPGLIFLGGFRSDMGGTKATHLDAWARGRGRAFTRFDYTGHGASDGAFEDGTIGAWAADALAVIAQLGTPQILVGSSMGGWIAALAARAAPERVAGLVGIAAAPDFTEDAFYAGFSEDQKRRLDEDGQVEMPTPYEGEPHLVTKALIEDGRAHLVLRQPLRIDGPVRLLQGTADAEVPLETALRFLDHLDCPDARLTLVKGADHRFSDGDCLTLIERAIDEVTERAA